jgi:hypothetical protein
MTESLEARVNKLEKIVEDQALEIRNLKDIEAIGRLQRAYGYYLEHWMAKEIIDLFSQTKEATLTLFAGTFSGITGIKRYFNNTKPNKELLHQLMQVSGIVDVSSDGLSAKGRWSGFGAIAIPRGKGMRQNFMSGIYLVDYVKEDGVWKFLHLQFDHFYSAVPLEGWVSQARLDEADKSLAISWLKPDFPREYNTKYPSGHISPFHYKHPVTGKKTSEDEWNKKLQD